MCLWRAVDREGEVLDILVQARRNKKAALKAMRKLRKKQGVAPTEIVRDKLRSYGATFRDLGLTAPIMIFVGKARSAPFAWRPLGILSFRSFPHFRAVFL